jgi:hypothetical protein
MRQTLLLLLLHPPPPPPPPRLGEGKSPWCSQSSC